MLAVQVQYVFDKLCTDKSAKGSGFVCFHYITNSWTSGKAKISCGIFSTICNINTINWTVVFIRQSEKTNTVIESYVVQIHIFRTPKHRKEYNLNFLNIQLLQTKHFTYSHRGIFIALVFYMFKSKQSLCKSKNASVLRKNGFQSFLINKI